jgi:hypothetical protein
MKRCRETVIAAPSVDWKPKGAGHKQRNGRR